MLRTSRPTLQPKSTQFAALCGNSPPWPLESSPPHIARGLRSEPSGPRQSADARRKLAPLSRSVQNAFTRRGGARALLRRARAVRGGKWRASPVQSSGVPQRRRDARAGRESGRGCAGGGDGRHPNPPSEQRRVRTRAESAVSRAQFALLGLDAHPGRQGRRVGGGGGLRGRTAADTTLPLPGIKDDEVADAALAELCSGFPGRRRDVESGAELAPHRYPVRWPTRAAADAGHSGHRGSPQLQHDGGGPAAEE
eukprot:scaffold434_cov186-Pinguiococcus_pyrenoidosus.AAC.2